MNAILRAVLVGIVVAFGSGTLVLATGAPDPAIGTWTLNLTKSKFGIGQAPKSETRTYARTGLDVTLTVKGVAADGSPISYQVTYRYDGKDYAVTGSSVIDALSVSRVNMGTTNFTAKKAGKVVLTGTRSISADGKVLTHSIKGTDATGIPFDDVGVYDKQ